MTQTGRYGEWVELKLLFFFFFCSVNAHPSTTQEFTDLPERYTGSYKTIPNPCVKVWDTVNGRVSQHKIFPFSTLHSCDLTFILNTFPHHESNVNVLSAFSFPATPFCATQNQPKDMVVYLKEQFVILFRRPLLAVRWREHPLHRPLVRG